MRFAELGKNNIISKVQQSATIFSTSKSAAQNAQFHFLISEAKHNFRNELFESVKVQRSSAIVERIFVPI